jgi:hypothetical protein
MSWHIADANTELNAAKLLQPWLPDDPNEAQISVQVPEQ